MFLQESYFLENKSLLEGKDFISKLNDLLSESYSLLSEEAVLKNKHDMDVQRQKINKMIRDRS